jgi:hypothetical protein
VSEENLAAIRKRSGQYLVGTPRRQMKRFEAELLQESWTRVRPEVEVRRKLDSLSHGRPSGKRESDPGAFLLPDGRGSEAPGRM